MDFGGTKMNIKKIISVLVFCLALNINAIADDKAPPEVTVDGLHLIKGTEMARVYAKPGVDLSQYNNIHLVQPHVAFIKDWQRQQNRVPKRTVTKDDMQRMKSDLAGLFIEVFKQELQNNGYVMVDEFAEDVLIVRPAIVDLNVIAPYLPRDRNSRSSIASAGSMTLYMELIDSVTGDKLVMAIDNKYDRSMPSNFRSNADRNETAARELLGEWAELLRKGLDEARTVVNGN
jgi:hypothetical protein